MDDLVTRAGLRRDEILALAEVGALASFGGDRRTALWQAARAGRHVGPLLLETTSGVVSDVNGNPSVHFDETHTRVSTSPRNDSRGPFAPMSLPERVRADYDGTGLTIGPHPMSFSRASLAARGVLRAIDLHRVRVGRRVLVGGAVITRQRPGTAKGFVFLSLEDETGIANVIITPDTFGANKRVIVDEPYVVVEGVLQNQDGAVSVKADRIEALASAGPDVESHDFH